MLAQQPHRVDEQVVEARTRCSARARRRRPRHTAATSARRRVAAGGARSASGSSSRLLASAISVSSSAAGGCPQRGERLPGSRARRWSASSPRSRAAGRPGRRSCRRRCGRTALACSRSSRAHTEWKVAASTPRARCSPSRSASRSRSSPAARTLNVTARISRGRRRAGGEQVRDAVGERAGLAGAGAGDDQQRAGAVADGLAPARASGPASSASASGAGRARVGAPAAGCGHGITSGDRCDGAPRGADAPAAGVAASGRGRRASSVTVRRPPAIGRVQRSRLVRLGERAAEQQADERERVARRPAAGCV